MYIPLSTHFPALTPAPLCPTCASTAAGSSQRPTPGYLVPRLSLALPPFRGFCHPPRALRVTRHHLRLTSVFPPSFLRLSSVEQRR